VLEAGDVLLMNTNGPPVGKLMGFLSPAGQLGLTHTAMCYAGPKDLRHHDPSAAGDYHLRRDDDNDHALVWEMFETGADIRPIQGEGVGV